MSEPTPLTRALALIRADPKQRLAYEIGGDRYIDARRAEDRAAAYLLLTETPPAPPRVWTVDDVDTLIRRAAGHNIALNGARDLVAVLLHDLSRDLDPTARAATEGALGVACTKLAALVGGAR